MNRVKVSFHFPLKADLGHRTRLKSFIEQIFRKEGCKLEGLSYVFCSDRYLLQINQDYLHHNEYTDIITFDLSPTQAAILGEIYISVERVRENARLFSTTIKEELHRVIFHGALHLCGYKDKTPKDQAIMRQMEDKYLALYFK
jgi:probable rRNA maturation factor